MGFRFQSSVPVGALTGDEIRIVMRIIGMSLFDLDRAMVGDKPDFLAARSSSLKRLLRQEDGSAELRAAVHSVVLNAAGRHVDFIAKSLRASIDPASL